MSLTGFITIIHVIVALFMIAVVLVQGGNSGGVGAAFGSGNSTGFFGATGGNTFFQKLTYGAAAIFMITSITLTVRSASAGKVGLVEKMQKEAEKKGQATEPVAPAADTTAPAPSTDTTQPPAEPSPAQ
jgi:preprotein translocase subunit SecG